MKQEAEPATGLYDVKRLAKHLGVKPSTIRSMKRRGSIPEPLSNDINGGAVWAKEDIDAYFPSCSKTISIPEINSDLPYVVDLFSGCGGMSLGFLFSGFNVIAGFDNWKLAVETYNANLNHPAYNLDLSDVDKTINTLKPYFKKFNPAIIGGPPCQDFSSAGKRKEGHRADLTEKFAMVVSYFRPPFFVMENVARIEKADAFSSAKKIFLNAGYHIDYVILNSAKCGVPQRRHRLFTIGTMSSIKTAEIIDSIKGNLSPSEMTVRDWFGDSLDTEYYYRHPRSYSRRGIFSIDEPSPTIRGVNRPIPSGYTGHDGDAAPIENARPLTTAERASIQTFPSEFQFMGSKTAIEQMIGNAVPVRLAEYVGSQIASVLLSFQNLSDAES